MKRKVYAAMLLALMLGVSACGKETPAADQGEKGTVSAEDETKEPAGAKPEKSEVLANIYPEGDRLEELVMGTWVNGEQTDFCRIQVPSNYWIGAGYLDEERYGHSFEMADGDDKVGEALSNGLLSETGKMYDFFVNNRGFAEEATILSCNVYSSEEHTYEEIKELYPQYTEFVDGENPALYFQDSAPGSGDLCVCRVIGDKGILLITYEGPVSEELGIDKLAQSIYDLITVTE